MKPVIAPVKPVVHPAARPAIIWGVSQRIGRWCAFDGLRLRLDLARRAPGPPGTKARKP
jgi:hypothetical protein